MAANRRSRARRTGGGAGARTLLAWLPFWENELGARGCSEATVRNQAKALRKLARHVGDVTPGQVTPERLDAWRDSMRDVERLKDSTTNRYLLTVGTFFNWLAEEGVIGEAPTLSVALLRVREEVAPPVFDGAQLGRLAKGAAVVKRGRSEFEAVRDQAIVSLLADTGLRASECAGLLLDNVDLAGRQAYVHADVAKGGRARTVTFGFQTARALNRYLGMRDDHPYAFLPQVFLGRKGAATYTVIRDVVRKAGLREGVIGARPHLFRHTWAHDMKSEGVSDEVLMSLGGWSTHQMLNRYGRAERTARAVEAYQRIGSPVDRQTSGQRKSATKPGASSARRRTG